MTTLTELKPGYRLNVLIALALLRVPTRKEMITDKASVSDEVVSNALRWLSQPEQGLVMAIPAGRHPLWCLTATARQMLLPIAELLADPNYENLTPLPADSTPVGVVLIDSESPLYIKTTPTSLTPLAADSTPAGREHAAKVARALLRNGIAPNAGAHPLPADLVAVVDQLTALRLRRTDAELSVAASPWPADKQLEQIAVWQAYAESKYAKGLNPGLFPKLVAARLSTGDECPVDTRADGGPDRYDGYLQYQPDSEDDSPQEGASND